MANTISSGATTVTPSLILGYSTSSDAQNVRHDVIGAASPSYTLAPDRLRAGTLGLLFLTAAAAETARAFLVQKKVFVLASSDLPQINMSFIREGAIEVELDEETFAAWIVRVGYQEVTP